MSVIGFTHFLRQGATYESFVSSIVQPGRIEDLLEDLHIRFLGRGAAGATGAGTGAGAARRAQTPRFKGKDDV